MVESRLHSIFKKGSKTYFYSTLFFPRNVKEDVFRLYGFVRTADNLVDSVPQDRKGFEEFKKDYYAAMSNQPIEESVIDSFVELSRRKGFDPKWTDAFLRSMDMDLHKSKYESIDELNAYLYGSAEVVGLFMARLLELSEEAYPYARALGRAMQFINFIRDIDEDLRLGRTYFPQEELRMFGLEDLTLEHALKNPRGFKRFIRFQVERYRDWMMFAEQGYSFIPKRYLLPIKTASDMYSFTAWRIYRNPFIVFKKKVKPSIPRIVIRYARNRIISTEKEGKDVEQMQPQL